jgi:ribosomal protein S18 acetylase RimI-like enzyme
MTGVLVRAATPADFDAIGELTVAAYGADGQLEGEHDYATHLRDVANRAGAGELLVAVDADDDGSVLGAVTYVLPGSPYAEISRPGEAEFRMLAVAPAAQGRGVGAALARACVERAREQGCDAVVICVRDIAATARRMYDRLGFTPIPDRDWSPYPGVFLVALRLDLAFSPDSGAAGGLSGRAARTPPSAQDLAARRS